MVKTVYSRSGGFLSLLFLCAELLLSAGNAYGQATDSVVSMTLEQAIELGITNSYKLKSANLAIEAGEESIRQKKTDRLPDINLALSGYLINDPILYNDAPFGDPQKVDYTPYQVSGSLAASQVIYAGSRIKNSINQQVLQKNITEFLAAKTSADVKMTIIREYLRLYTLVKDYQVNVKTIKQIELRLKTLRSKFQNGQVVKNDVSRSELQKLDFELKLINTINNASASNYFLTRLLGLSENTIIQVDTAYNYTADTVFVFDESLVAAFNNRPEYQIARTNKKLSENTLKIVKGAYYPTVTGVGMYGLQNPVPGTFPPQGNFLSYLTVGLGVNYNLGTFYKTRHQKLSADLAIQREVENIKDLEVALSDEVKTQLLQYEIKRQSLAIYAKKIRFAEDNYKIIQSRYYNDLALISDMVDAELEYNQALLDFVKGQVQTRLSYYEMMKVIGKL
jgi:outer membrane protein TolC